MDPYTAVSYTHLDVYKRQMSSLKGKKHGGANLMVMNMMDDIKSHVKDYEEDVYKRHRIFIAAGYIDLRRDIDI